MGFDVNYKLIADVSILCYFIFYFSTPDTGVFNQLYIKLICVRIYSGAINEAISTHLKILLETVVGMMVKVADGRTKPELKAPMMPHPQICL